MADIVVTLGFLFLLLFVIGRIMAWIGNSNVFAITWGVGYVVLSFWMLGAAFFG
jgi:hypothetical protein